MKKLFWTILLTAFVLSGCFNVSTVVNVKKNGSGTVKQTVLFRKDFIEQMKSFSQSFGDKSADNDADIYDVEKLKKEVTKYGENVRYVSSKEIEEGNMQGYEVVYAFDDINKLSLNENPNADIMPSEKTAEKSDGDEIKFHFKKGGTSELTIQFPDLNEGAEETENAEEEAEENEETEIDNAAAAMLKQMYAGMKVSMKINFDGKITNTDASNVDGSTITLFEMDFDKILQDPSQFKLLEKFNPDNPKEMKKLLKDAKGIKIETKDKIRIKFK